MPVQAKCPLCNKVMMTEHCESSKCNWYKCTNKACQAQLDPVDRRGTVLLKPDDRYRNGKGDVMTHRRLVLVAGMWVNKDAR